MPAEEGSRPLEYESRRPSTALSNLATIGLLLGSVTPVVYFMVVVARFYVPRTDGEVIGVLFFMFVSALCGLACSGIAMSRGRNIWRGIAGVVANAASICFTCALPFAT